MSWPLWVIIILTTLILGGILVLDMGRTEIQAQEDSPWIELQSDVVNMGSFRMRIVVIQNILTDQCFITKNSIGSALTLIDCPEGK